MTIQTFLALLDSVSPTKTGGWLARCPAHDDHHPSLIIDESHDAGILIHCRAGCDPRHICEAVGATLKDLFESDEETLMPRVVRRPPRRSLRDIAYAYELHGLDCEVRADAILAAAKRCEDCATWTDEDLQLAMQAVARGYTLRTRSAWCYAYADHLRERHYELASTPRR